MKKLTLTIISSALLISGCSMTPDYERPDVSVADVYLHASNSKEIQQQLTQQNWWHKFADEQLIELVEDVQQQNINIKQASERINAANAYHQSVASYKVPTLSLSAGVVDLRFSENEAVAGGLIGDIALPDSFGGGYISGASRDSKDHFVGLNASWELDIFGRIESMSAAAKIRAEQAEVMKTAVNTAVTADVINNYLQYRGAQSRLVIAQQNVVQQEQSLALVRSLFENGYSSELDIANEKTMLATTKSALLPLKTAQQVHLNRIAILLGESVNQTKLRFTDAPLPQMQGLVPTGLPSQLLTRRPDIALAEREIAAKNEEVGAAIAAKYPSLFLTGAPSFVAGDFDDLINSDSISWSLGAGVSWNIFDGGRGEAMVDMQKANFKQSVLSYQHTVNAAFNEVETTLYAYANAQQFNTQISKAVSHAEMALDKARVLYRAGLIDHISVLNAQKQNNQLKDAEVLARLNTATTVVMLHKSLGGDWQIKK
ncbi:efflux transporter outer membrane subunit [Pseudoalteromonas sp. L1]|uniref:efflux transporter outer membrane subunit n=1 Tax=Pseudoalteromonas sp. L1 TaxID=195716 RepID=UPI001F01FC82|nr:efflux transporter outer membrane subunit [Pseudoalteromonas sp. L1]